MAVDLLTKPEFLLHQPAPYLREKDPTHMNSNINSSNVFSKAAPAVSSERPRMVSSMSIMKEAVCSMGIPDDIVQLVIDAHRLDHKEDFTEVTRLFSAADEIFSSTEKRQILEGKLHEAERAETAKAQQTDKIRLKAKDDDCCSGEAHVSPFAEMPKAAEAKSATASKSQLQEKVKKLARENQRLKQRKLCRACKEVELATSGVTFLPCGHFITCETCSEKFDDCPACGKSIMGTVRTFLA